MDSSVEKIADILVCPKCKGTLRANGESLICDVCGLKYEIEDGIAKLIIDKAKRLKNEDAYE